MLMIRHDRNQVKHSEYLPLMYPIKSQSNNMHLWTPITNWASHLFQVKKESLYPHYSFMSLYGLLRKNFLFQSPCSFYCRLTELFSLEKFVVSETATGRRLH